MSFPGRKRFWICCLVLVVGLAAAALVARIVYNLGRQLKPEQLAAARKLWRGHGLANYQFAYTIKKPGQAEPDSLVVRVRGGKVLSVSLNSRPLEPRLFRYYGMEAMFDDIDRFLQLDGKTGQPRTYARAWFDAHHGGLRGYVRRVLGGGQFLEITVDSLLPLDENPP